MHGEYRLQNRRYFADEHFSLIFMYENERQYTKRVVLEITL